MDSKIIGGFICERRQSLGMTQQQLADMLDVTNKAISKWETGEGYPDITIVPGLAKALGVTADELLAGQRSRPGNGTPVAENEYTAKRRKQNKLPLGPVLVVVGIVIAVMVFMIGLEQSVDLMGIPMYLIAFMLIMGGVASDILNKANVRHH